MWLLPVIARSSRDEAIQEPRRTGFASFEETTAVPWALACCCDQLSSSAGLHRAGLGRPKVVPRSTNKAALPSAARRHLKLHQCQSLQSGGVSLAVVCAAKNCLRDGLHVGGTDGV